MALKILPAIIAVVTSIIAYIKYNSTREVAKRLIDIGKQNFGIEKSKYKTFPLCWEWSVFLSGLSFCCGSGDCCSCCLKKSADSIITSREHPDVAENATSTKQEIPMNYQVAVDVLVHTPTYISPSKAWKITKEGLLDQNAVKEFNLMLKKCHKITYSNFLLHFQKYADSLFSIGRNSHKYHCRHAGCKADGHSQFANAIGCLEPICFYGVLDWNRLPQLLESPNGWYFYSYKVLTIS